MTSQIQNPQNETKIIKIYLREAHFPSNICHDTQSLEIPEGTNISTLISKDIPYLVKLEFDMDPFKPSSYSQPLTEGKIHPHATYEIYRPRESKKRKDLFQIRDELERRLR